MHRFLVTLRSHAEGPVDEHFVDVKARSIPGAIAAALKACPGVGAWAIAQAIPWPSGARGLDDAVRRQAAGARRR